MKKLQIRPSVPVDKIFDYMNAWHEKNPHLATTEIVGQASGYDVCISIMTDSTVSDEDKQVVLIIAQHCMEISGVNTVYSVGNYLMSGCDEAKEMLKKLIVVLMPCPNPYTFAKQSQEWNFKNEAGIDEYISFTYKGARDDGKAPAAELVQKVIDRFTPEMLIDSHGLNHADTLVIESLGVSAFAANRFYNSSIMEQMQDATSQKGFSPFRGDFAEINLQTDRQCDDKDINAHFMPTASGCIVAPIYSYLHYHTLAASIEVAWEESGLEKVLEALRIGCRKNKYEYYPGYPTRTVVSPYGHNSIRAYGKTAKDRRASRLELWKNRHKLLLGVGHPERPGLTMFMVSCSPELANKYVEKYYNPMQNIISNMKDVGDADKMLDLVNDSYESFASMSIENGEEVEIKNGMTLRMGLPFADAKVQTVLYNGEEKQPDELDGYTITKDDNWVFVDLHIPPEKVAKFAIAMIKYDCEERKSGIVEFD